MPPIAVPVVIKIALGALGAAAIVHWVVKEVRRINEELDRVRAAAAADPVVPEGLPTLRRDPQTGEWRVL
jgi:hypothetical protein